MEKEEEVPKRDERVSYLIDKTLMFFGSFCNFDRLLGNNCLGLNRLFGQDLPRFYNFLQNGNDPDEKTPPTKQEKQKGCLSLSSIFEVQKRK